MIVTKRQEHLSRDIEAVFESLAVKEFCVLAANYIWLQRSMVGEQLVLVLHLEEGRRSRGTSPRNLRAQQPPAKLQARARLVLVNEDFPRTASLKTKRNILRNAWRSQTAPPQFCLCRRALACLCRQAQPSGLVAEQRINLWSL